jgi:hypothetical protein
MQQFAIDLFALVCLVIALACLLARNWVSGLAVLCTALNVAGTADELHDE